MLLSACGAQVVKFEPISKFDYAQAKNQFSEGTNTIKGSALIRQMGGGIVTCAGRSVYLVPATDYAMERISVIYGSTEKGYNPSGIGGKNVKIEREPFGYRDTIKSTTCDSLGFFKFEKVANGSFFVTTTITWQVNNYSVQGGSLMSRVSVRDGSTAEVVLAN